MPIGLLALAGLVVPLVVAYAATPVAIRVAGRLNFYDHPVGYKGHGRPTPYLGGAAVVSAFVLAALIVAGHPHRTVPVVVGMLVLWCVGTVDDRIGLSPWLRLVVEAAVACGLWVLGLGWDLGLGGVVDLAVTVFWITAVVNAFNLFDNMDGAASTIAAAAAAGTALLGVVIGDRWLTVSAAALCGACLGFLPHNLSSPAKIFLGDGGSMPVGFGVGALVMVGSAGAASEWQALAMGLLFVGIPAVDTCLVVISRRRRGVPLLSGGRDHLTHRARGRLRTARAVAVSLGAAQALLAALALMTVHNGSGALVAVVCVYLVAAIAVIAALDANFDPDSPTPAAEAAGAVGWRGGRALSASPAWVLVPLGLAVGLSSFASGVYASTRWAPIGLALIALLVAVLLARPVWPGRPAVTAIGGFAALAGWALLSGTWGESTHAALVAGNRLLVLTTFLAVCVLLIRGRQAAAWALGAAALGALCVGAWELAQMLFSDGHRVITSGRLQGPLGYINGQGCVAIVALFPCVALAERRGRPWQAGLAAACATALAGLAILSQSRGAALGVLGALIVVLLVAPGRARRLAAVTVVGLATVGASHWLLEVYRQGQGRALTPGGTLDDAALALLAASVAAGAAWGVLVAAEERLGAEVLMRAARGWRWALTAVGVLLALAAIVRAPAVANAVSDQLHEFSHGKAVNHETAVSTSRLGTDSSNRYEYWRLAVRAFRDHPVGGVGAGSYAVPYFQRRTTAENVTQPHSLPFQTLSELGIVGLMLLLAFVGGVAWGILRCARAAREHESEALLLVGAAGAFTAWLVHTSVDWIHLLPGVTAAALVAAAVTLRPLPAKGGGGGAAVLDAAPRGQRSSAALVALPLVTLAIVAAAVSLGRQVLAEHYRGNAEAQVVRDPRAALHQADLALGVDGSDLGSLDVKAAALSRLGREAESGAVLRKALAKEPENFVTYLLLGDHEVRVGNTAAARVWYRRVLALNPRDPTIRSLARHPGQTP